MIASFGLFWHEFLRPGDTSPRGGYWFWSGIGSDLGEVTLLAAVLGLYRHRNCFQKGCWRIGHIDPKHSHPACRKHHSQAQELELRGE